MQWKILEVDTSSRQDGETQAYQAYSELLQRCWTGWIDAQYVKLFMGEHIVLD
jgi:hypothetical protein